MTISLEPVQRLARDVLKGTTVSPNEMRYLVDHYYQLQRYRLASANQERALKAAEEPYGVIAWFFAQTEVLEKQLERALDYYSASAGPVGEWLRSVKGVGPVLAANLLAELDITKTETCGGFWRFAGLDPTLKWGKGEKRPYNGRLKTTCWKLSDSWVKLKNHEDSHYSRWYVERKVYEQRRNDAGELAEQAAAGAKRVGKDTEAYAHYTAGKLPPGQIDMRARRWTVKLFLAHLHRVMYETHYDKPAPRPYILEHGTGHVHIVAPPGWPLSI